MSRAHSKFSASGADRWFNCPGSVALSEGLPEETSEAAERGTRAHKVLELFLTYMIALNAVCKGRSIHGDDEEMTNHAYKAASFIFKLYQKLPKAEIECESRALLNFIRRGMFGTYDGAVIDFFGTLHVFDFKYGSHPVSPKKNLQLIFYAIALAHKYHWNFKRVRMWIIQPRVSNGEPIYWDISIEELEAYVPIFKKAVERVEKNPTLYKTGDHCFFCRARKICPEKRKKESKKLEGFFDVTA